MIGPDARTYVPIEGVSSYIGRTGIDHGGFLCEMIVMACEDLDPCKVGYLNGVQALTIDQDRVEAMTEVIAAHPNIEIVANQEAFYLENVGLDVATNMLLANPDINVLATSGDQMMLGAEQAVIDAGLVDQIKLIGNGTGDCLANPPCCVSTKAETTTIIEFFDSFHQTEIAFLNQIALGQTITLI